MKLSPGEKVTERIQLTRPLGSGGMGTVWAALNVALDTEVAVKFVSSAFAENHELSQRFAREAKLAAQIRSPHVVQMFDHGVTDDGTAYIVMELLRGESLAERLRRDPPLTVDEVADILEQASRGLSAAHALDVVHRDIKPDNLFLVAVPGALASEVHLKVLDFGIARQHGSDAPALTRSGATIGTVLYMSPEQLDDTRNVGFSTDLWALAVVAYQALTGRLPFRGESAVSLWQAIQRGVFEPPSALVPPLSPALDAWFARALDPDPGKRFDSARLLAEAFRRAAGSTPANELATADTVVVNAGTMPEKAAPSVAPAQIVQVVPKGRRRSAMALFLLALAAIAVAGVAYVLFDLFRIMG